MELRLTVVSVLLKIRFGHIQIQVSQNPYTDVENSLYQPQLGNFYCQRVSYNCRGEFNYFWFTSAIFCWRKNFWSRKADTFLKVLIKRNWHFQRITAKRYKFFQGKFSEIILLSCSDVKLFSKSLLIGISANSTFRTVFDFKKLKIIHCWNIYHFLLWLQASVFLK